MTAASAEGEGRQVCRRADFRRLPIAEMETILARFEERVNAAQQANPPTKAWVKAAILGNGPGPSPVTPYWPKRSRRGMR